MPTDLMVCASQLASTSYDVTCARVCFDACVHVQGDAGAGSEALSSVVLDIAKGKLEREVQVQVSVISRCVCVVD